MRAAEIEGVVVDQIRCIAGDKDLKAEVFRQAKLHVEEELSRLKLEQKQLRDELKRHHREIRQVAVNPGENDAAMKLIADWQERIRQAEKRLPQLEYEIGLVAKEEIVRADVDLAFRDFDSVWMTLSPREQGQLVGLLVSTVEFDPGDSSIELEFHPTAIKTLARQIGGAA